MIFNLHVGLLIKMGIAQLGGSTLAVGSIINSRREIKQLLEEYHKFDTRKSTIVDSNITRRCTVILPM